MKGSLLFALITIFACGNALGQTSYEVPSGPFLDSISYTPPPISPSRSTCSMPILHFKQFDAAWGNNNLGTCPDHISGYGCAMTSCAMLLKLNGITLDPGILNTWLTNNNGYAYCGSGTGNCCIKWTSIANYPNTTITWYGSAAFNLSTLRSEIDAGNPVIVHVDHQYGGSGICNHYLVVYSYTGNGTTISDFLVSDPGTSTFPTSLAYYGICSSDAYPLRIFHNVNGCGAATCAPPSAAPSMSGATSCPGNPTTLSSTPLSWSSVSGATGYNVYVSKYPYGSSCNGNSSCVLTSYNPYNCLTLGSSTSLTLSTADLEPGMLYRWNVYPTSDCNNSSCDGPGSAINYFYVPPTISPSSTQTICSGAGVTLSTTPVNVCNGGSVNYQWYKDGNPIVGQTGTSIYATQSGSYYVQFNYSGSSCCSSPSIQSASVNVVTSSSSTAPSSASANPPAVNSGQASTLTVNGGSLGVNSDWVWYSGSCGGTPIGTGNSITVNPTTTTNYYVRGEGGCNTTSCVAVTVTVNGCNTPTTPNSASANPPTINSGQSSTLSLSGGSLGSGLWVWYSGSCGGTQVGTGSSISVTPNSTTTYYVRGEGCGQNTACVSVIVTVSGACTPPIAASSAIANPSTVSTGQSSTLSITGGSLGTNGEWVWYSNGCGGSQVGIGSSLTVSPTVTTTYYVRAQGCGQNTSCVSVTINVSNGNCIPPVAAVSASASPNTINAGQTTILTVNGGSLGTNGQWVWYSGNCSGSQLGAGSSISITPTTTNTYYVRGEGCSQSTACVPVTVTVNPQCNTPIWLWDKGIGNTGGLTKSSNVATDKNGNVYVTGYFSTPTLPVGSTTFTNAGSNDVYVIKYDSLSNVVWARSAGGSGDDKGYGIITDKSGNIYITGNFASSSITFGSTTLTHPGFFLVKLDSAGNTIWAKDANGTYSHNFGNNIATDTSGNICITGTFSSSITFGSTTLSSNNGSNIFVVKYDNLGNVLWARQSTNNTFSYNSSNGIATDKSGNIYITGNSGGSMIFGSNWTIAGLIVAKIDATGSSQSIYGTTSGNATGTGLVVDNDNNNIIVTGYFNSSSVTLGTNTISNAGSGTNDILFATISTAFNSFSLFRAGGSDNDLAYGISIDPTGSTYVTGTFRSASISFGTISQVTLTSTGAQDGFVVKFALNYNGQIADWTKPISGASDANSNSIAYDNKNGTVYVVGDFNTNAVFDNDSLIGVSGLNNVFTAKLGKAPPLQPSAITGNQTPCNATQQSYTVNAVTGATSYSWYLPNGWTGFSTTNSIATTVGTNSGLITVTANNGCGSSPSSVLNVTVNSVPPQPSPISGNGNNLCQGSIETYAINTVANSSYYSWSLPAGWSGTSTTPALSTSVASTSGTISVAACNVCGCGLSQTLSAYVRPLPSVPMLYPTDSVSICEGTSQSLTIANPCSGCSYYWSDIGLGSTSHHVSNSGYYFVWASDSVCPGNSLYISNQSNAVNVIEKPNPVAIACCDTIVCSTPVTLIGSGGSSCYWYNNNGYTYNFCSPTITPTAHSVYYFVAADASGCKDTASVDVQIKTATPPLLNFTVDSPVSIVNGCSVCFIGDFLNATTLIWYFDDGQTSNASNPCHTYTQPGNYSVTFTGINQCGSTVDSTQYHQYVNIPMSCFNPTDLMESEVEYFKVYPNPTDGIFVISGETKSSADLSVNLLNTLGQTVHKEIFISNKNFKQQIDMSNIASGVYHLQLQIDGKTLNQKLVIQ